MPLHNGRPYKIIELQDIKDDEELWVVPDSKEACRSYENYKDLLREYRKRVWACQYTGKANLMYKEALAEEAKAVEQLQKVSFHLFICFSDNS